MITPTNHTHVNQPLPAGINTTNNIEFFGDPSTKKTYWLRNGQKADFDQLPPHIFSLLSNAYNDDLSAKQYLVRLNVDYVRQVELYTYYCWGSLDHTPDIKDSKLQPSENFRHNANCISLHFENKKITIEGTELTPRDLTIIDLIADDAPDKAIADSLGITVATLGFHKGNLLRKTNTQTKTGLLKKAMREQIIN